MGEHTVIEEGLYRENPGKDHFIFFHEIAPLRQLLDKAECKNNRSDPGPKLAESEFSSSNPEKLSYGLSIHSQEVFNQ
jgi:hypothetical protein